MSEMSEISHFECWLPVFKFDPRFGLSPPNFKFDEEEFETKFAFGVSSWILDAFDWIISDIFPEL